MTTTRRYILLILLSVIYVSVAGCAAKKVSGAYSSGGAQRTIRPSEVRKYSSFSEIQGGYNVHGMLSAEIIYGAKMTESSATGAKEAEKQEALLREGAAQAGANAIVGVTSLLCKGRHEMQSCCLMASVGGEAGATPPPRPRVIVCMLPTKITSTKTDFATKVGEIVAAELQFHLGRKGYYAYRCDNAQLNGKVAMSLPEPPAELAAPLGIQPDFVLESEIADGTFLGLQALISRAVLYDLKEKRIAWEWKEGESEVPAVRWGLLEQATSSNKKWFSLEGPVSEEIHEVVKKGTEGGFGSKSTLPTAAGYGKVK